MVITLDTNVLIHLIRGHDVVRNNFAYVFRSAAPMAVSVIVVEELMFGVARHRSPATERALLAPIMDRLEIVPFEQPDAEKASQVRAELVSRGKPPPYADFLIGAHALTRGHTLVTANIKDFQNIPGLQLLDWTQGPQSQDAPHA